MPRLKRVRLSDQGLLRAHQESRSRSPGVSLGCTAAGASRKSWWMGSVSVGTHMTFAFLENRVLPELFVAPAMRKCTSACFNMPQHSLDFSKPGLR
eukprot:s72_g12.t1